MRVRMEEDEGEDGGGEDEGKDGRGGMKLRMEEVGGCWWH